jgi:hypothetical protein
MDAKQIMVNLPNVTNFQMYAFGQGNNEEYLIHVITVKHILEQKGTNKDVGKAFEAVAEVRKQLELLLKAPKDGEMRADKDKQKRKLSAIKEELKTAHKFTGAWSVLLLCCQ